MSEANRAVRRFMCHRAPDIHLIGRDLMFALCHAEYLVFMGQACLPPDMQAKLGTLRAMSRSGASPASAAENKTVGFTGGSEGYK